MHQKGGIADAVGRLRSVLATLPERPVVKAEVDARDEVLARFGPVFSSDHVAEVEESEVKAFLRYENNRHWSGLHRQGNRLCADMPRLRGALSVLVDESQPLSQRLDTTVAQIHGMGKAIVTAMLMMASPHKYGVWNNTSEAALRELSIWPVFERGLTFGAKYQAVNALLGSLAAELNTDLWTLDAALWASIQEPPVVTPTDREVEPASRVAMFGLERHLHEFLRDNWDQLDLGREWRIYEQDGEEAGYEYPCDVGRIDLLAQHRKTGNLLVIELKRNQTGDATVGQVLRYMGWVRRKLAPDGATVEGLIIAHTVEPGLLYAVEAAKDVQVMLYEVSFHLRPCQCHPEGQGNDARR